VEGSDDGESWRKYRYPYTMTDERSRPRYVAPHHPRLDHQTFYDAVGVDGTGYLQPVSFSNPYLCSPSSVLDRTIQRVLETGSPAARLFAEVPFDGPPRLGRAMLYRFTPTTLEEKTATGRFWNVAPMGAHIIPTAVDSEVWHRWMPPPELFHAEAPLWRRRARVCRGVDAAQLSAFWDDFIPFVSHTAAAIAPADPFSWQALAPLQLALRRRYTREEVRRLHLTLGRLTMVLMARLDAVFSRPATHFMRDVAGFPRRERPDVDPFSAAASDTAPEHVWQALAAWPHGALRSRFHVRLAAQWVILGGGRDAWLRMAGRDAAVAGTGAPIRTEAPLPRRARRSMTAAAEELGLELAAVLDAARTLTMARGMFLEGVVNYDMLARQASRLRVLYSSSGDYTPAPTGIFPGVFELTGELREQPSLCELSGWGGQMECLPLIDPPRMVFGEDSVWREVPQARPAAASGTL
jgi:hypothetical protein